jgi:hypothetical protein
MRSLFLISGGGDGGITNTSGSATPSVAHARMMIMMHEAEALPTEEAAATTQKRL